MITVIRVITVRQVPVCLKAQLVVRGRVVRFTVVTEICGTDHESQPGGRDTYNWVRLTGVIFLTPALWADHVVTAAHLFRGQE